MDTINELSNFLIISIRAGASMRMIYCFIRMAGVEEEQALYRKRMRNVVVFYAIAELAWVIKDLIVNYFS